MSAWPHGAVHLAHHAPPRDVDRELIESAPDGILLVDADGVITLANPQCAAILGCRPAELLGQSIDDFVPPEVRERHAGHRDAFMKHPVKRPMGSGLELYAARPDGSRVPVEISLSPVSVNGLTQTLAIVRDVSERRRAEETIRSLTDRLTARVAHLEVLNDELESFSYSISHDLRAPLRAIDGFSQALLEDYGELLPADGLHFLDRMRAGAQRMSQLIDDLLALARISRWEPEKRPVNVTELASNVMRDLTGAHPERRFALEIEDGISLSADPRLLRIALENLLGNAWKFTGEEPVTRIRVCRAELDGEPAVRLEDNGIGFPLEQSGHIFEAFHRLQPDGPFPGTGIGLAIVDRIVRRHGGRVAFESELGKGTAFTVRTTPPAQPRIPDPASEHRGSFR